MDGGEIGELEFENFNAANARIVFKGRNIHPGYAKNKMVNSIAVANEFMASLPKKKCLKILLVTKVFPCVFDKGRG